MWLASVCSGEGSGEDGAGAEEAPVFTNIPVEDIRLEDLRASMGPGP